VSTDRDFCNSAEVGFFIGLVYTSVEVHRVPCAKFCGMDMELKYWKILKFCEKIKQEDFL
jgi:hypothetical protein